MGAAVSIEHLTPEQMKEYEQVKDLPEPQIRSHLLSKFPSLTPQKQQTSSLSPMASFTRIKPLTVDNLSATQLEVYSKVAQPLVSRFVEGYDVDLLSYGQTCSGKTYTMFGPPQSMGEAARDADAGNFNLKDEHGILSLTDQSVRDLQQGWAVCFVDEESHLQGAEQKELNSAEDVARFAASVETRLTRGTNMNDTSSRSHCIAGFKLTTLNSKKTEARESRLQFFDLMGSERFKGQNAAHDESKSSHSSMGGCEGIYSNLSLMALTSCVKAASDLRRKSVKKGGGGKKGKKEDKVAGMLLTKVLAGSLTGHALTGIVTCVSQAPRNGDESWLSLQNGGEMAKILNKPQLQPSRNCEKVLANARKKKKECEDVVARGVAGKYQALRQAQVKQWAGQVHILEKLLM
ncbi:hypothetical protein TL16_g08521 [Triparma laevis f. inornata]|uniref:Kinesin motor domain-containing protein n=1 Tax=Triparma laevis f. inornata TaxID=1714386 RepID=A0A9W7EJN5_9STRA|nr:hypothetical protein TL16_g08521 [Triparma laevis f. inornata]